METFQKYPRTPHLEGSRLQPGDSSDGQIPVGSLLTGEQVWEEKVDGANSGISFSADGELFLQSRGHQLTGGGREAQFNLLKKWTSENLEELYLILFDRYIMYGEWCYAKHTVFYDALPHYFLEFDIFDKQENIWLDTDSRHNMLKDSCVVSVPVVHRGLIKNQKEINKLIKPSLYKTENWRNALEQQAILLNLDTNQVKKQTENSDLAEGLYLKHEMNGQVIGRYKFVRPDFLQTILDSGSHWATRTILPNLLADGIEI